MRLSFVPTLCLAAVALVAAAPSHARAQNSITVRAARVLDGKGGALANATVEIRDGRIVAVDQRSGPVTYDLGNRTLLPGMIVSNEPGYYKTGAYGIRIENLVAVSEIDSPPDGERKMLGFETLTLAPVDRALIETSLMTTAEIAWIDAYHQRVRQTIRPLVDAATAAWLDDATRLL